MEYIGALLQQIILIAIVPAIIYVLWLKLKTRPAIPANNRNQQQKAVVKRHTIYTVLSIVSLILSIPIMLFFFIGAGMSPGSPHMSYGELIIGVFFPLVVFILQYLDLKAIQPTSRSKIVSLIIIAMASLEMLFLVLMKLAG